jgi:hypothetical protein
MAEFGSVEPILDDEILYRRIPVSTGWYQSDKEPPLDPEAFRPNRNDTTGISLFREKLTRIEEAARGRPDKNYYIAVFRAGDMRAAGMEVVPRPVEGNLGHAEISSLRHENRKSKQAIEWRFELAHQLCLRVEGPFRSKPP